MKHSSRPRATAELSRSLNHQLNMYTVAAGAAGVCLLALAQPTEARIVYTKAHKVIVSVFDLDLNHDGTNDFVFSSFTGQTESTVGGYLRVGLHAGARVGGKRVGGKIAPPKFGGPTMASFRRLCFQCATTFRGPWELIDQ